MCQFVSILGTACIALSVGCNPAPVRDIDFVLPDGFAGRFAVLESADGVPTPLVDGGYVIHVPDNGVVELEDLQILGGVTRRIARYANGNRIPYAYDVPDDQFALRDRGQITRLNQPERCEFFVGDTTTMDQCSVDDWPPTKPLPGD